MESQTVVFSYRIAPRGAAKEQALLMGNLWISDVAGAKQYVLTLTVPNAPAQTDLEVTLKDMFGSEIWRGPYLRNGDAYRPATVAWSSAPPS